MVVVVHYCDTSFLAPLFLPEATSTSITAFLNGFPPGALTTSHWTRVEFSSMLARHRRMKLMSTDQTDRAEAEFDRMLDRSFSLFPAEVADHLTATKLLRSRDTALRAADALHLAIARNRQAKAIFSLDKTLIREGRLLGLDIGPGIDLAGYREQDL